MYTIKILFQDTTSFVFVEIISIKKNSLQDTASHVFVEIFALKKFHFSGYIFLGGGLLLHFSFDMSQNMTSCYGYFVKKKFKQ